MLTQYKDKHMAITKSFYQPLRKGLWEAIVCNSIRCDTIVCKSLQLRIMHMFVHNRLSQGGRCLLNNAEMCHHQCFFLICSLCCVEHVAVHLTMDLQGKSVVVVIYYIMWHPSSRSQSVAMMIRLHSWRFEAFLYIDLYWPLRSHDSFDCNFE